MQQDLPTHVPSSARDEQLWNGKFAPIASTILVNDGHWHHVVLSQMGSTQTLYLDGKSVSTLAKPARADVSALTYDQMGAAEASSPLSWPAWGSGSQRLYKGAVDEVALYSHPLGPAQVAAHYPDQARHRWQHALAIYTELGVPDAGEVRAELAPDKRVWAGVQRPVAAGSHQLVRVPADPAHLRLGADEQHPDDAGCRSPTRWDARRRGRVRVAVDRRQHLLHP